MEKWRLYLRGCWVCSELRLDAQCAPASDETRAAFRWPANSQRGTLSDQEPPVCQTDSVQVVQAGLTVSTPVFDTLLRLTALDGASTDMLENMLEAALDRGASTAMSTAFVIYASLNTVKLGFGL